MIRSVMLSHSRLIAPAYRALPRSATIAAAVSSIDRRLTSIIGQPWRVQIWRA